MIVAAIDIGSNSVRLLIAAVIESNIQKVIYEDRAITRLAAGLNSTGKLSESSMERTISTLLSFNTAIQRYPVEKVKAVATSAVREATNQAEFLSKAEQLSFPIQVISGDEESRLTLSGVRSSVDVGEQTSLMLDIGGGSTEWAYHDGQSVVASTSIKFGVVKLADRFDFTQKITTGILNDLNRVLAEEVFGSLSFDKNIEVFMSTAGTPTSLAAIHLEMLTYDAEKVNGFKMTINEIRSVFQTLCERTATERTLLAGLEKGREDLLIPGTAMILYVMEVLNFDSMVVCDHGLREGVALAAAG